MATKSPKKKTASKQKTSQKPSTQKAKPLSDRATKALEVVAAHVEKDKKRSKIQIIIDLLNRPGGTSLEEIATATGWQHHTIRAALSREITKKRGLLLVSDKPNGEARIYKINA